MDFEESERSKIFDNEAFGYWKVTVERPLRLDGGSLGSTAGAVPRRVHRGSRGGSRRGSQRRGRRDRCGTAQGLRGVRK